MTPQTSQESSNSQKSKENVVAPVLTLDTISFMGPTSNNHLCQANRASFQSALNVFLDDPDACIPNKKEACKESSESKNPSTRECRNTRDTILARTEGKCPTNACSHWCKSQDEGKGKEVAAPIVSLLGPQLHSRTRSLCLADRPIFKVTRPVSLGVFFDDPNAFIPDRVEASESAFRAHQEEASNSRLGYVPTCHRGFCTCGSESCIAESSESDSRRNASCSSSGKRPLDSAPAFPKGCLFWKMMAEEQSAGKKQSRFGVTRTKEKAGMLMAKVESKILGGEGMEIIRRAG